MKPNKAYHIGKLCVFGQAERNLRLEPLYQIRDSCGNTQHIGTRQGNAKDCRLHVPCPEPKFVKDNAGRTWAICLGVIAREWYPLRETKVDHGVAPFPESHAEVVIERIKNFNKDRTLAYDGLSKIIDYLFYAFLWKEAPTPEIKLTVNGNEVKLSEETVKSILEAIE